MDDGIRKAIAERNDELIELRRDFHQHPELGFKEIRTSGIIEDYLQNLGLETKRCAETGVTAVMEGTHPKAEEGPTLMLRADMDALPIQEENDVPYKSQNDGVMHACGHDAHSAMLMIAAKILNGMREKIPGRIKLVFQPDEEIAGGIAMVKDGLLEDPKVDAALGAHIWTPLPSGTMGVKSGPVTASMYVFKIVIKGKGGHTGYPEKAIDPVIAAADIIQRAQNIQTREISAMRPTIIMFGKVQAGTKNNIIPDEAVLEGSMRFLYNDTPEGPEQPAKRLKRLVERVCESHECECDFDLHQENIAVVNDKKMTQEAVQTARKIVDRDELVVEHQTMAGEDFSEFAALVPSVFVFVGTGNEEKGSNYSHHNPKFAIDEDTLPSGVELYVRGALDFFEKYRSE